MNSIPELLQDIRSGQMVILIDDEDRENEGDLILAADHVTPEKINFMAKEARGLICLALPAQQISNLDLPLMVRDGHNKSPNNTAFTVSVEAAEGVTTGISAADRAHTVRIASHPDAKAKDVITPGHIFPIQAQEGGVLKRAGHTEASVDLCNMAGLNKAAVICEIMNDDGSMARVSDLKKFAEKHNIKIGTIEDLIQYRIENESYVVEKGRAQLKTGLGNGFEVRVFLNELDGREHLAFVKGEINSDEPVLVRVHTECLLGDVFGDTRSNSGKFIQKSIEAINKNGSGVIVYLRLEGMGNRLLNRIQSYQYLDQGVAPKKEKFQANRLDRRDYGVGAQILRSLGVQKMNLITNNPSKRVGLKGFGIEIVGTYPLAIDTPQLLRSDRSEEASL